MIYIVEDDTDICELEQYALRNNGFETTGFGDGKSFFAACEKKLPELVILDIIRHLAHEHGMSVIVNTHFPAHALKLSDKALLLGRGEANLYGAARDVITEDNMRRAFGVNVSIHDFQRGGVTYNTVVPLSIAAQG